MSDPDGPWTDPDPGRPIPIRAALAADVAAHYPSAARGSSRGRRLLQALKVAATSAGFRAVLNYRLAHAARARLGPPGAVLASLLFWWNRHAYGCAIAPAARLHGGLILPHPQGIVVGDGAVVGPRAWIYQNVTLGGVPGRPGLPRVGSDARIFAGAVLAGPVAVGDGTAIGANAVVSRDVPGRSLVRPAAVEVVPMSDTFYGPRAPTP